MLFQGPTFVHIYSNDFAVSNGVFHHLNNMEKQFSRVLKPEGWFWYSSDGKGAISMDKSTIKKSPFEDRKGIKITK